LFLFLFMLTFMNFLAAILNVYLYFIFFSIVLLIIYFFCCFSFILLYLYINSFFFSFSSVHWQETIYKNNWA